MIVMPSRALWLPPWWRLPVFETAGKGQRNPANGKGKRKVSIGTVGKTPRNTAGSDCCCGLCKWKLCSGTLTITFSGVVFGPGTNLTCYTTAADTSGRVAARWQSPGNINGTWVMGAVGTFENVLCVSFLRYRYLEQSNANVFGSIGLTCGTTNTAMGSIMIKMDCTAASGTPYLFVGWNKDLDPTGVVRHCIFEGEIVQDPTTLALSATDPSAPPGRMTLPQSTSSGTPVLLSQTVKYASGGVATITVT